MSTHRAQQKRLEKKKKERESKRHARVRATAAMFPTSMAGIARRAADCEFGPAFMSPSWRENESDDDAPRLVSAVVTRVVPSAKGELVVAALLVDRTFFGVKDAFVDGPLDVFGVRALLDRMGAAYDADLEEVSVDEAQSVVLHAVAFAKTLGFEPHRDFAHARIVLGEPESLLDTPLARPSRPIFVAGSDDDIDHIDALLARAGDSSKR